MNATNNIKLDAIYWASNDKDILDKNIFRDKQRVFPDAALSSFSVDTSNYSFQHQFHKNITGAFPIDQKLKLLLPINSPSKSFFIPEQRKKLENHLISCVDTEVYDGELIIAYPNCPLRNSILISAFYDVTTEDDINTFLYPRFRLDLGEECEKTEIKKIQNNLYCILKGEKIIKFHLPTQEQISSVEYVNNRGTIFQDVALHPEFPDFYGYSENVGHIYVNHIERNRPVWYSKEPLNSNVSNENYQCKFSHNSMYIYGSCSNSIKSFDYRTTKSRYVFNIQSLNRCNDSYKNIITFNPVDKKPFLYVNCEKSIYLVDERFVKLPVLSWEHMLGKLPNLSSNLNFQDNDLLVVANNESKKFCIIANNWKNDQYHTDFKCSSVSLPKHFDIVKDHVKHIYCNDKHFDECIKRRFNSKSVGIAFHSNNSKELYSFMYNEVGDLLFKSFNNVSEIRDEIILERCNSLNNEWENKVKLIMIKNSYNPNPTRQFSLKNIKKNSHPIPKLIWTPTTKIDVHNVVRAKNAVKGKTAKILSNNNDEINEEINSINVDFIKNTNDKLSNIITKLWLKDKEKMVFNSIDSKFWRSSFGKNSKLSQLKYEDFKAREGNMITSETIIKPENMDSTLIKNEDIEIKTDITFNCSQICSPVVGNSSTPSSSKKIKKKRRRTEGF